MSTGKWDQKRGWHSGSKQGVGKAGTAMRLESVLVQGGCKHCYSCRAQCISFACYPAACRRPPRRHRCCRPHRAHLQRAVGTRGCQQLLLASACMQSATLQRYVRCTLPCAHQGWGRRGRARPRPPSPAHGAEGPVGGRQARQRKDLAPHSRACDAGACCHGLAQPAYRTALIQVGARHGGAVGGDIWLGRLVGLVGLVGLLVGLHRLVGRLVGAAGIVHVVCNLPVAAGLHQLLLLDRRASSRLGGAGGVEHVLVQVVRAAAGRGGGQGARQARQRSAGVGLDRGQVLDAPSGAGWAHSRARRLRFSRALSPRAAPSSGRAPVGLRLPGPGAAVEREVEARVVGLPALRLVAAAARREARESGRGISICNLQGRAAVRPCQPTSRTRHRAASRNSRCPQVGAPAAAVAARAAGGRWGQ